MDTFGWGRGWYKKKPGGSLGLKICMFDTFLAI